MMKRWKSILVIAILALFVTGGPSFAQPPSFFDDFENYSLGTLEKDDPNGPNQAPNGSGNPWFGPQQFAPNCTVVGPENGVQPHSGQQMIRGQGPSDIDQNWYNLAYRLNSGLPFMENVSLDRWFHDP